MFWLDRLSSRTSLSERPPWLTPKTSSFSSKSVSLFVLVSLSFCPLADERVIDSFSNVFAKLLELGVPTSQWAGEPWILPSRDDQEDDKKTSK